MIVFLLLIVVAILLFGASAILRAGLGLLKLGLAILVLAVGIGLVSKVPGWAWAALWSAIGFLAVALVIWWVRICQIADEDTRIIMTPRAQEMLDSGMTADEVVAALRPWFRANS